MGRRTFLSGLALAAALAGCTRSEADLRSEDRRLLAPIVACDKRASEAMHDADAAVARGDEATAVDILETRARPAIDEGLRQAERAKLGSAWGRAKGGAILAVLRDRRRELPRYEQAMQGAPEEQLAAIQDQAEIERRAIAAVAGLDDER